MADQNRVEGNDQSANAGATDPAAAKSATQGAGASAASSDVAPEQGPAAQAADVEVSKADTRPETSDASKRGAGQIMVMPPVSSGGWENTTAEEDSASMHGATKSRMFGKRRLTAMAAVFALAAIAGVVGGSLTSAAFGHLFSGESNKAAGQQTQALQESIRKLSAEVAALKSSSERSAKADAAQLSKVNDRIEKVEKAQAEPAAKIAKLSETVDKLRVASVAAAPAPAAAKEASKEFTGSIPTPVAAPNRTAEVNRLPTVEGWRLRDVANGGALIEGRQGLFEVYAGDPLPGLGRVDAIRRQDGRWVVVTSKGLIVAR